jgi:Zn-dependent M32 family carboxypeptidase
MGDRSKKPFRDELSEIAKKILGREPGYYDDFYFFRNKAFSDMETNYLAIDPLFEVKKILELMEFDITKIHFDTEDRKNKYPSPICFFIHIPNDIRVLYKKESPYFDLQGCFHETGHAIHANSIGKNNEYWDKYRIPMGIEEIFSIFLERVIKNSYYVRSLFSSSNMDINSQ